jgi:hypothetical protein
MDSFISGITGLVQAVAALIIAVFLLKNGGLLISSVTKVAQAIALIAVARKRDWDSGVERLLAAADLPRARERDSTPAHEGYNPIYFARKHGISRGEAERIIKRVGNDREKLNRAAERAKRRPRR